MSITTQGVDARGYLTGWLNAVTGMYIADVNAIPDDKWTESFGGCTRNGGDLTADAASLLLWTTGALSGNAEAGGEGDFMDKLKAACSTKAGAIDTLKSASEGFGAAVAAASDEALNSMVTPPWQMETPMFMLCQIAVNHIWYHDAQLNYIQCLLGDEKVHWMGD